MSWKIGAWTLAIVLLLFTEEIFRFLMPKSRSVQRTKFKAGYPSQYPLGTVDDRFVASHGVWIVATQFEGRPQIVALSTVCTHLGCIIMWNDAEQAFKCPCHGSGFRKNGVNFEGPAPRPLDRFAIAIADDGQIEVDTARNFRQELGQWSDPRSYVEI